MTGTRGALLAWPLALCCCQPGQAVPGSGRHARPQAEVLRDDRLRAEALRRALVWREPAVPIPRADLRSNPPGPASFRPSDQVACRFRQMDSKGRSPKFECVLSDGEVIKVKYGRNNPEVFAEVAASRLLTALGFGADRMFVVASVRCSGCPLFPYPRLPWLDALLADKSRVRDFDWVAIERRSQDGPIEGETRQGWDWPELDATDPAAGGASREHVEALRLMAVFLAHWDAKSENQRLVCLADGEAEGAQLPCARVLAYIHDLGKTFGPRGVSLEGWTRSPIWKDSATCRVSMESLPYEGAAFGEATLSEAGRQFLAQRLRQLSEPQIHDLFAGARFAEYLPAREPAHRLEDWVGAFQGRVREISDRPPCPVADAHR